LVEPLQVERDGSLGAVDLEGVLVAATAGEARGVEGPHRPVFEAGQEAGGVIHGHLSHLLATLRGETGSARALDLDRPLLAEGLHRADHLRDRPDEELRDVGDVRTDVAVCTGYGQLSL